MLKLGELGEVSFRMYNLGALDKWALECWSWVSFRIYKLGELGEVSSGILKLGELDEVIFRIKKVG